MAAPGRAAGLEEVPKPRASFPELEQAKKTALEGLAMHPDSEKLKDILRTIERRQRRRKTPSR